MLSQNKRGFTLVELIVVMAIFMTILMITASAFKTIVNSSTQQSKSVETQIEGIVGLEVLRADLEHAGFGLPWAMSSVTYVEATDGATVPASFWPVGQSPVFFNDAVSSLPGNPPRAILSGNTTFNKEALSPIGSNYLVIKSTMAAANVTSKKWTTVSYNADGVKAIRQWGATDRDFSSADRVIVVKNSLMTTPPTRQLMAPSSTVFSATFGTYSTTLAIPHQNGDTFEIYGIHPDTNLRMPFNRADYYVKRPGNMPKSCMASPGVGILYKATVIQGGTTAGELTAGMPLLDCVADMQVVYGLDNDGIGRVNQYLDAPANTPSPTAADIRSQLREIRVYILAQEGIKDLLFNYPSETVMVGEVLNGIQRGRLFNLNDRLGTDYKSYRWKVYTIVVRPKNLFQ
jgi:prepilin-type N-terminal cleavage/methylation domain-containing protein